MCVSGTCGCLCVKGYVSFVIVGGGGCGCVCVCGGVWGCVCVCVWYGWWFDVGVFLVSVFNFSAIVL